ncbi:hypothetical protein H257_11912 [Aphanomyces astaci]|uniref:Uncharacterized protein n=1 Tax=Aphanomyces astaci TaxID=112090 RepID=W4G068_APHAT|nr:hypothetical protein H257_11912 [Aphanomyces astaci]ETV73087.1 hypothetical protein H257_11912 [Aphanomyces astaci]|eukprot:XP_009837292.1 hypothetical protein H257_11912 [Aphanomyces astaci]
MATSKHVHFVARQVNIYISFMMGYSAESPGGSRLARHHLHSHNPPPTNATDPPTDNAMVMALVNLSFGGGGSTGFVGWRHAQDEYAYGKHSGTSRQQHGDGAVGAVVELAVASTFQQNTPGLPSPKALEHCPLSRHSAHWFASYSIPMAEAGEETLLDVGIAVVSFDLSRRSRKEASAGGGCNDEGLLPASTDWTMHHIPIRIKVR